MNVLVLGSGGREHALCEVISKSEKLDNLYAMPGNPGIATIANCVDTDPFDNEKIIEFSKIYNIDLIIPGSEVYLENGIVDAFVHSTTQVFGPSKKAAQIESSKKFAKDLMSKYHIPTAKHTVFKEYEAAKQFVCTNQLPLVIKYDGLAGGKGVVVATTMDEAMDALKIMLFDKKYGNGNVIIEECLEGPEFSLMCFVHNETIIPMPIAQDHKRLRDGDKGPNTGGMGIYSNVPLIDNGVIDQAFESIMKPIARAMVLEECPFTGFLYGGLMLTKDGPKVIEFNARFGDPEAEVILPKLESDILNIIMDLLSNKPTVIRWSNNYHVGVVLASNGYPNSYKKGYEIKGIENTSSVVYHMGTKTMNNKLLTNGGRVLLVTGIGKTLEEAIKEAYLNVQIIQCENLNYRKDIGSKSVKR